MIDEQDLDTNDQGNEINAGPVEVHPDQALLPEFPDLARTPTPEQISLI